MTDAPGNTATDTVEIVVGNPPANQAPTVQVAADPAGGTAPLKVNFSSAAHDPDGDALSTVWDFGDGGKAGGPKATHTFAAAGTYTVSVTVTDTAGNTGTRDAHRRGGRPAAARRRGARGPAAAGRGGQERPDGGGARVDRHVPQARREGHAQLRRRRQGLRPAAGVPGDREAARRWPAAALASRTVTCAAGETVAVRVKPSRAVRRALRVKRPRVARGHAPPVAPGRRCGPAQADPPPLAPDAEARRAQARRASKRRRRSAFATTDTLERTIARLAITGLSSPAAASGIAARL